MPKQEFVLGRLELIAFLSGACVMALEITGSRILAPYLGTSIFVWTTLIGVIMASLSTGYWWGGRLADRVPTAQRLAGILALAATCTAITAVFQRPFLNWLEALQLEVRLSALLGTLLLFAPASILMGMVTPYLARLKLNSLNTAGATVGSLYAISTAGSIAGTFAAGYFLLAWMGSSRVLYGIAAALLVLSFVAVSAWRIRERSTLAIALSLFAALAEYDRAGQVSAGVLDVDTAYQRLFVADVVDPETNRPVRILRSEKANTQSAIYLDSDELFSDYLKCFHAATRNQPSLRRVLMIGAAAYAFPRFQLSQFPALQVDAVEIDPAMSAIAERYFRLQPNSRLHRIHADGRTFLNQRQPDAIPYDVIYIDAFQTRTPPFHLTTAEFVRALRNNLRPDGMVAMNLIAKAGDHEQGFAPALVATFRTGFPHVALLQVDPSLAPSLRQNFVLLASAQPLPAPVHHPEQATPCRALDISNWQGMVLSDDFAPVELLAAQ